MNRLQELADIGQAVWLDFINRDLILSGDLQRMIQEDSLSGLTSNPSIFEKMFSEGLPTDSLVTELSDESRLRAKVLYEHLAVTLIQQAADLLKPVYEKTQTKDGYVSLEVSPELAYDTAGTIDEALRLWQKVDRPNLMIKVPGTDEGILAIRQLISEGINVNVTLLFGTDYYQRAAQAFVEGLEIRAKNGGEIKNIASVASFFVSRIDTLVDSMLSDQSLKGKVAIANAKQAFEIGRQVFQSELWQRLECVGAQQQRLLWASTSTKNPNYRDVIYVEELIGPHTVNTLPPATFSAFKDHGVVALTLAEGLTEAREVFKLLEHEGVSFSEITAQLLKEGVHQFEQAFERVLLAVESKRRLVISSMSPPIPPLQKGAGGISSDWESGEHLQRFWAKDSQLWSDPDAANWLGWLDLPTQQPSELETYKKFADSIQKRFSDVVIIGMGGSILTAQVYAGLFDTPSSALRVHVFDSIDPTEVLALSGWLDLSKTFIVVASKSGTTQETCLLFELFWKKMCERGILNPGQHFAAITDSNTSLVDIAKRRDFYRIFYTQTDVGGRFSALSAYGFVPAALMGINIDRLLEGATQMARACFASVPAKDNPGVALGLKLAAYAKSGKNKITFVLQRRFEVFGHWLEQLLAESTGKEGIGLVPIVGEPRLPASQYGNDRIFVRMEAELTNLETTNFITSLKNENQPVIEIDLKNPEDIGAEFFRWEMAIAVAANVLGINPFDQPDVESQKKIVLQWSQPGASSSGRTHVYDDEYVCLYADGALTAESALDAELSLADWFRLHLARLTPQCYFAFLAFLTRSKETFTTLRQMRLALLEAKGIATCTQLGTRYLHSTGQLFKGGPKESVFMQIMEDETSELGTARNRQANADFEALIGAQRSVIQVVFKKADRQKALEHLSTAFAKALL